MFLFDIIATILISIGSLLVILVGIGLATWVLQLLLGYDEDDDKKKSGWFFFYF